MLDGEKEWEMAQRMMRAVEDKIRDLKESHTFWQRLFSWKYRVSIDCYKGHLFEYKLLFIKTAPMKLVDELMGRKPTNVEEGGE